MALLGKVLPLQPAGLNWTRRMFPVRERLQGARSPISTIGRIIMA
jgi:hypothetical protein